MSWTLVAVLAWLGTGPLFVIALGIALVAQHVERVRSQRMPASAEVVL